MTCCWKKIKENPKNKKENVKKMKRKGKNKSLLLKLDPDTNSTSPWGFNIYLYFYICICLCVYLCGFRSINWTFLHFQSPKSNYALVRCLSILVSALFYILILILHASTISLFFLCTNKWCAQLIFVCAPVICVVVSECHVIYFPPKQNKNKKLLFSQIALVWFLREKQKSERNPSSGDYPLVIFVSPMLSIEGRILVGIKRRGTGILENKHKLVAASVHWERRRLSSRNLILSQGAPQRSGHWPCTLWIKLNAFAFQQNNFLHC